MKKSMKLVVWICILGVVSIEANQNHHIGLKSAGWELAANAVEGHLEVKDVAKAGVHYVAVARAVPVAIEAASVAGVNAGTGVAIAELSGAAAISATSAAIGAPAAAALGTVGIVVAPAVVGGVLISGAATAIAVGINYLFFD